MPKTKHKKIYPPRRGMHPKYWVALVAVLVIGLLEAYALFNGIDGTLFTAAMAGIGAVTGYALKGSKP